MTEQASETQVADSSSAEQGAQAETSQAFIDAEGKFKEGWKEHYVPEDMRADKVFDTFNDVSGGLKMLGHLQNMIGKKGVIVPGEADPQSTWDNFHREMGRPDTKDLYAMKVPEDLTEIYDQGLVAEARDMFFELGYDQKKVDRLWAFEEKRIRAAMQTIKEAEAKELLDADNAFQEWRVANPQKFHWANRLIAENTNDEEHKNAILELADNNVAFAELLSNVGSKFMEHGVVAEQETVTGMSAGDALAEANKIENTPGFLLPDDKGQFMKDVNRPEYDRLEQERTKFYQIANKNKPG